jgi:PIN domain nuclease of toxin-antitoxin system
MLAGVADTHVALWYLFGDPRLSPAAKTFIDEAAASSHKIALSAISLAEIVYLVEKQRIAANAYHEIRKALSNPEHVFEEVPLQALIVDAMQGVSRKDVPDMPDRIVAATAVYAGVPVVSRDGRIRASKVQTVW